ncbi:MAG: flagellar export chaperone FliS [Oceanidesulfovibrio sp.]
MQKAAQAYFQTQVSTTSQGELLLMLYDGAVKFLRQAQEKINEKDYAQKGILISKALDVIAELDGSLNVQKGGEIAQNLHNLYFYCNTRLLMANMNMDNVLIDEVIKILTGLRSAYAEIIEKQTGMASAGTQKSQDQTAAARQNGPRPPLLLNTGSTAPDSQTVGNQDAPQASASEQHGRGDSPLESLATQIARNPVKPKPQPAPSQGHAEHAQPADKPAQPDMAAQPETPPETQAESQPQAEQPEQSKPSPARGRLLAGASIYKKMASQS